MDRKQRLVDIHAWNQPFYGELSQTEKLFYWFIISKCDNVGVYRHNPKLAAFHCDGEIDLQSFIEGVNFDQKRIELISEGVLWVRDFVQDTWGTIAAKNNLGLSCYKLLVRHGMLDYFITEYPNSINIGSFREAIKENQKGYGDLPLPQGSPSLPQGSPSLPQGSPSLPQPAPGLGSAGTINITNNITNNINDTIGITESTPEDKKKESLSKVAERCLNVWPQTAEDIFFAEINLSVNKLREMTTKGVEIAEAEKRFTNYLKGERTRIMETGEECDLEEIINAFDVMEVIR